MTDATASNNDSLDQYTLVSIQGLESEAGKKLNGGLGILLDQCSETNGDGVFRYPVRVFALQDDEETKFAILGAPKDKKLKTGNVQECSDEDALECFRYTVNHYLTRGSQQQQQPANENTKMMAMSKENKQENNSVLFWLASCYKVCPEAYHYGISYANALREIEGNHKQAAEVCLNVLQTNKDAIAQDERCPSMYKEAVLTFCDAQEYLETAISLALLIPTDNPEHKAFRREALAAFGNTAKKNISTAKGIGVDDLAQWNFQAAQALYELDPHHPIFVENLGAAYCLLRGPQNNLQGAQWYRKARAMTSNRNSSNATGLVLAQLQCLEMPLADYHVLNVEEGRTLTCVHRNDLGNLRVDKATGGVVNSGTKDLDIIQYEMPQDPDDPEVFSVLLDKLQSSS